MILLKNRNLLLLYSHKETKRLWFKFFIIIHCEITHKKEYLSICARNWSLNMHSHKIDSLHFISTYTLNSRDGGAIWDGWDMYPKCSLVLFEQYLAMKVVIFYNKPKRVSALCDVGNRIFSKSWEYFLRNFLDFFGIFWEDFFGGIFWEKFFGRFLWEEFFVYIDKVSEVN